ncbi:MAG: DUF4180 domain-containing protein [Bacteroidetes bacterium]|nr:DUF4180 domain-containing protein [Bacteroidota bacterium]MBU1579773.1 DUF4180 domain-containing protein [Bacteroidota bacterium]MBU2556773.1 DUF4180 domain-containing protein [Bacteroidota bacterium]
MCDQRLAIVGNCSIFESKSLNDFIYESNKSSQVNFESSGTETVKILYAK